MSTVSFLLVDDLDENLLSLEALLKRDGLTLLKARSGDEALELLLHHDVALALIDVQMPGLNGFDLAELMRGNERTRRIPIIFVTAGSADSQRRFRGYEAGAVDFIQKPIEADILRSKADVFFELYRQRQQIAIQRDELKAQARALQEADQRKDEFLATLAHELRNPLAPLRSGLDVLQRNPSSEQAAQIRDIMDRQLAHLVRLVDDLLDMSRISQGKIELQKERMDVAEAIHAAVEATQPSIRAAGHTVSLRLPQQPVWIEADATRVAQVISNLVSNAAKYTPPQGRIDVSAYTDDANVVIEVSDNGIGIPAKMQSKVFQLFAQIDHHLDRSQGGLGIGLALVKQLVTLHGGTVNAQSAGPGKGSVFSVTMPLAPDQKPAASTGTQETLPASAKPLTVLVVDDNVDVAQTVGWLLEEIGHGYRLVHNGRDAIAAAAELEPDAILLDIGMPGMNGYEVCQALRKDPRFQRTPIIAQTGWGQETDKISSSNAGFSAHLTKPVALEKLKTLLSDLTQPQA